MNKQELKELARKNSELYGDSIYLIFYETKYSQGRFVVLYAHYMTDERFRKKLEKALSAKDIVAVERHIITAAQWLDVYHDMWPLRVTPTEITWEEITHGT